MENNHIIRVNTVKKGTKVTQMAKVLDMIRDIGISTYGYWMIGLPSEDEEGIMKTQNFIVNLIKRDLLSLLNYGILVPYPGTDIFENPKKFGIEILTYDYSKYHEYGIPVYRTATLLPEKIFDLWKRGLGRFSEVL